MDDINTCIMDEEPLIFYNTSYSSFGVSSKHINSPRNILISYSPLSSNHYISFSNTIMIPSIITKPSIDTEKNIYKKTLTFQNEKSRISLKKDSTRLKTESSKDEKYNVSLDKQITKTIMEINDMNKIDESSDKNEINDIKNIEDIKNKNILESNPYFLGRRPLYNINHNNKLQEINNNETEKNKVKKILNKNKNIAINEVPTNCLTCKNIRKKQNSEVQQNKNKLTNKIKRMKSLNNIKGKLEKRKHENKIRHSTIKHKTSFLKGNNSLRNSLDKIDNNQKNMVKKNIKIRASKRGRLKTVMYNSPIMKLKDNNIKINKANFYNIHISSKLLTKDNYNNIIKDKKEEKEKEKNIKEKKKKIKYEKNSDNSLKFRTNADALKKFSDRKEKNESKTKENNNDSKIRKTQTSVKSSIKKMHTINTTNEKKKIPKTSKKKMSESMKKLDFESALKNKNNLAKTQFNLFSPDKFTNTEFCDSDYCEYTLECMDLILNKDIAQRQIKSKVNFNFPKSKGKKQKKIALFDLDETLVHCTGDINLKAEPYQHCINVVLPGNIETKVGINIRPFWKKTLNLIKKYYHIVVFTASHQAYADAVLDFMDPTKKYFNYRLYRNNCSLVDINNVKFYVKDLDIFNEFYDLKDIIIIDNSVLSFIYHLENGIPIVPYYNEDKDGSLYVVGLYLIHIYKEYDLREANKKYINLNSFLNEAKEKKIKESPINEESFNSSIITESIEKKESTQKNTDQSNKEIRLSKSNEHLKNLRRCSFSIGNNNRMKLMSRSKLINVYYEINNQPISEKKIATIIEEKSNKSFSVDEGDINESDNEEKKNLNEILFRNRIFSTDDKPFASRGKSQSNKVLNNFNDLKYIRSNFFNMFSEKGF
jgi:CTD small phosphatase-like protein 2